MPHSIVGPAQDAIAVGLQKTRSRSAPKDPVMNNSMALAADPSRLAALRSLVLTSHLSRMLVPVLDRALPIGRLGGEHRATCS